MLFIKYDYLIMGTIFVQVNTITWEVMQEFKQVLEDINSNPSVKSAVLTSGKPGCFIAGADVR